MSAFIIGAAYYSLQFGKNEVSKPNWDMVANFDFFDLNVYKAHTKFYGTFYLPIYNSHRKIDGTEPDIYNAVVSRLIKL